MSLKADVPQSLPYKSILDETVNSTSTTSNSISLKNELPGGLEDCGKLEKSRMLISQFDTTGDSQLLSEAIHLLRQALSQIPPVLVDSSQTHILRAMLANALRRRYEQTRDMKLLEEAISLQRAVLGHFGLKRVEDNVEYIHNLAFSLGVYYERNTDQAILNESIQLHREAIRLCEPHHPDRAKSLYGLAHALILSYSQTGNANNAQLEIEKLFEEILSIPFLGGLERATSLRVFACFRNFQYNWTNDPKALLESIELVREAVMLAPSGCYQYYKSCNDLATFLAGLAEHKNDMDLLEEAIRVWRSGLQEMGTEPDFKFVQLSMSMNLGNALVDRYDLTGDIGAQVEATQLLRECLRELPPHEHIYPLICITRLLHTRYERMGDEDALEECIQLTKVALELPSRNPHDTCDLMGRRAASLLDSYKLTHDESLLLESISLHREALALLVDVGSDYENRADHLCNLAIAMKVHFEKDKNIESLSNAESLLREALSILPQGTTRPYFLQTLADILSIHFDETGESGLIQEAIHLYEEAIISLVSGHPDWHKCHHAIAQVQLRNSSLYSWSEAMKHITLADDGASATPRAQFASLTKSLECVENSLCRDGVSSSDHYESRVKRTMDMYTQAVSLLPRAAHFGLNTRMRLRELSGSEKLCRAAAIRALLLKQTQLAVQVFEEGKAVFWTQTLRSKESALDILPENERIELSQLFSKLENDTLLGSQKAIDRAEAERLVENRRQMNAQIELMVDEIRKRPGLERFLKIPAFEGLARAAERGPVVVLLATETACFAIILVNKEGKCTSIQLPDISPAMLKQLSLDAQNSGLRDRGIVSPEGEAPNPETQILDTIATSDAIPPNRLGIRLARRLDTPSPYATLSTLWIHIVSPIIQALGLEKCGGQARTRVHWCPTGEFTTLPLHAAGIYTGSHQICASDYILSSYTPSLSILIKCQDAFTPIPCVDLKALLVAEANAPGFSPLHNVVQEVNAVAKLFPSTASVINEVEAVPTTGSVIDGLRTAHVLHLACHGRQMPDPLKSHFVLRDTVLSIEALMKVELPSAVFAFLSACETAKGDRDQPDQAVHLAASMLFCGFRSVVATMWTMDDADGPAVAKKVYEILLNKDTIDLDDIPYALDEAVGMLRQQGVPPARWATFVHMGA